MRVAVALSGGVDSAVAAALLKSAGHDVVAVTLRQWAGGDAAEAARHGGCCSIAAVEDARRVATRLELPFYVWNFEREFGERVVRPFHEAYAAGLTPNPCLRCNSLVRFDLMLGRVLELGFDAMATGHYARTLPGPDGVELHAAADPAKDQSYALYHLDSERLARIRFPLGDMVKPEVRARARELGLPVAGKPESMDLCFVPRGGTAGYLARHVGAVPGDVVDGAGRVMGRHRGIAFHTVGQRSGLGDLAEPGPWYVTAVDAARRRVQVGRRAELEVEAVDVGDVTFVGPAPPPGVEIACEARLRYRAPAVAATYRDGRIELERPFLGAAPGQAAVLYRGSRVLGGGIITAARGAGSSPLGDGPVVTPPR